MTRLLSFGAFLSERFSFPRFNFFSASLILGVLCLALTGFHVSAFQQGLGNGINAGLANAAHIDQGISYINRVLFVFGFGLPVLLVIVGAVVSTSRDSRFVKAYLTYLAQQNFQDLATTARALETDDRTRSLIVAHLSNIHPGWSYN